MSNASDFIIENGVLKKYVGPGGDVVIPNGINKISSKVFAGKKITSVEIPDGVTDIGDRAFYGVPLEKVHIPDSVIRLKQYVFTETNELLCKPKAIVFAGKVLARYAGQAEKYKIPDGTRGISDHGFQSTKLKHLTIPDSICHIGEDAFGDCVSLQSIEINAETVKQIGKNVIISAFFKLPKEMTNLREIPLIARLLLADTIELTGLQNVFESELKKVYVRETLAKFFITLKRPDALKRLLCIQKALPQNEVDLYMTLAEKTGIVELVAAVLDSQNKLSSNSAKQQPKGSCKEKVPEITAAEWKKIFKVSNTPEGAVISGYKGVEKSFEIPAYIGSRPVVGIKDNAFAFSMGIEKVILADGITMIGSAAFSTSDLTDITIPASVTCIGDDAFYATRTTIHTPAGSYAETYAKENNIPFVAE
jgi:hypothetical protein